MGDIRKQAKYIPELGRYESADVAKTAWRSAWKRVFKRGRSWAFGLLILGIAPALIGLSMHALRRWIGIPISPILMSGLVGGVVGGSIGLALQLSFRKPVRRYLREDLVGRGIPICVECGYDLRGLSESRCPECGAAFDAGLLSSERESGRKPE